MKETNTHTIHWSTMVIGLSSVLCVCFKLFFFAFTKRVPYIQIFFKRYTNSHIVLNICPGECVKRAIENGPFHAHIHTEPENRVVIHHLDSPLFLLFCPLTSRSLYWILNTLCTEIASKYCPMCSVPVCVQINFKLFIFFRISQINSLSSCLAAKLKRRELKIL